jgi:hypothetical protein
MTSEIQVKVNQENAKLSTGPNDTTETRKNAYKHGLTSDIVFCQLHKQWIDELTSEFRDHFKPTNIIEDLLIQTMAIGWFRKHKAIAVDESIHGKEFEKAITAKFIDAYAHGRKFDDRRTPHIPLTEENELVLRYETAAERSFYRALNTLNELRGIGFVSQK